MGMDRCQETGASGDLASHDSAMLRIGAFHHHIAPEGWGVRAGACQGDHLWSYNDPDEQPRLALATEGFQYPATRPLAQSGAATPRSVSLQHRGTSGDTVILPPGAELPDQWGPGR